MADSGPIRPQQSSLFLGREEAFVMGGGRGTRRLEIYPSLIQRRPGQRCVATLCPTHGSSVSGIPPLQNNLLEPEGTSGEKDTGSSQISMSCLGSNAYWVLPVGDPSSQLMLL